MIFINALIVYNRHVITLKSCTHLLSCTVYHYAAHSRKQVMKHSRRHHDDNCDTLYMVLDSMRDCRLPPWCKWDIR